MPQRPERRKEYQREYQREWMRRKRAEDRSLKGDSTNRSLNPLVPKRVESPGMPYHLTKAQQRAQSGRPRMDERLDADALREHFAWQGSSLKDLHDTVTELSGILKENVAQIAATNARLDALEARLSMASRVLSEAGQLTSLDEILEGIEFPSGRSLMEAER